jgi:hypothetical protein
MATGSITGSNAIRSSDNRAGLGGKWAEILKEVSPDIHHAAILFNPETAPYYA